MSVVPTPTSRQGTNKWKTVALSSEVVGGIKKGNAKSLWMWGSNVYRQLEVGDITNRNTPTQVDGKWDAVASGDIVLNGNKRIRDALGVGL